METTEKEVFVVYKVDYEVGIGSFTYPDSIKVFSSEKKARSFIEDNEGFSLKILKYEC